MTLRMRADLQQKRTSSFAGYGHAGNPGRVAQGASHVLYLKPIFGSDDILQHMSEEGSRF
jgi:hypothetical protein